MFYYLHDVFYNVVPCSVIDNVNCASKWCAVTDVRFEREYCLEVEWRRRDGSTASQARPGGRLGASRCDVA